MIQPRRAVVLAVPALAAVLVSGCSGSSGGSSRGAAAGGTTPTGSSTSTVNEAGVFGEIPQIVRNVQPSVVTIKVPNALGSGVIYRADGYIITNNHVVSNEQTGQTYQQVQVQLADGTAVPAQVVATDPLTDIAVVKTGRQKLPAAKFDTSLPPVGALAVAIGSPLGFQESVTAGIISGLHRDIPGSLQAGSPQLVDLVQTDAAISPGNSGGALVDADSQVVGINDAYIPPGQGAVSIGFAIPSGTATNIADQLIKNGHAVHAFLGVGAEDLTPQLVQRFGINADSGALVIGVGAGTPAAQAGIQPGDVIVALGNQKISSAEDLTGALRQHQPGDTVPVTVLRNGSKKTLQVKLTERPTTPG